MLFPQLAASSWAKHYLLEPFIYIQEHCIKGPLRPSAVSKPMCWSFSWGELSSSSAQGPQFSFSQEDFLTSILPSLTEIDTVVFIFTLDGKREDGSSGVSRWRQWSDSGTVVFLGLKALAQRQGQGHMS